MFSKDTEYLAKELLSLCRAQSMMLATAESCTGGLISGALTAIAGSSDVVDRGFVTYSNEAKQDLLGVDSELITEHGAVSQEVAAVMATGAIRNSRANLSIAVTGVAGPGASENKPAGLVYIGIMSSDWETPKVIENRFSGDRSEVRLATLNKGLSFAIESLKSK